MATKTVKASIIIGGAISGAFKSALSSTKTGLKAIGEEIVKVERRQRLLGQSIDTFGRMGKNVDGFRRQYADLTREADRLRAAQTRLSSMQSRIDSNNARRRELGGAFRDAAGMFGVVAAASLGPVGAAVQFESAMLGVAKQLSGARDAAGNLTPIYFKMAREVQKLGREIPLATNQLADMVAAGLRMGVAEDQIVSFTRTAAMMADAFELPAGQLADDMGKIAGLFHIPTTRIGELADAINYLDDKSQATGGGIIDVLRRIGGVAETLKMPAKEAAALGSTFLSLGSDAEVAATASNAVMRILGAATAQSKRVREGLSSIGFEPVEIQASMAKSATKTIQGLLDKLNGLDAEQRMVASTRIFGAEYGDDIAKLATGAGEYRRQLALVNSEQQKGSMSREFSARLKTTAAQWEINKNRLREVSVVIGNAIVPALNRLMEASAPVIDGFSEWSRAHPGFIKGAIGSALALSGLRVVTTGVGYAYTAVKGPVLSVMGFMARWRATGAIAAMGRFGGTAMRVVGAVRWIGAAIGAIGAGPIAIVVAALTAGALVVRKYWQPIKAFLSGYFDGVREAVGPAMAELGTALAPLKPLWDGIASAVGSAWNWFTKLLQPVNMTNEQLKAAGNAGLSFGHIVGGVMSFIIKRVTDVVTAITWLSDKLGGAVRFASSFTGVGGMVNGIAALVGGGRGIAMPAPAKGRAAPASVTAASGRGTSKSAAPAVPAQHVYHITQRPGESAELLAQRVADAHRRREAADRRGRLVDLAVE